MADFAGQLEPFIGRIDPANLSSNIGGFAAPADTLTLSVSSLAVGASRGTPQPTVAVSHVAESGVVQDLFGKFFFEQIIVIPRTKALGFVLTATQFAIEVWNTFRSRQQVLTAIDITGSGGLTLADLLGEPLTYSAFRSVIYQATVPSAGASAIDQIIDFVFASGVEGANIEVTGSRIVLFSIAPEWSEGMEESIEYLTDVLVAYSDNEQRRGLRQIPRRAMRFRALALNARDSAGMESLVWGWQNQPYGVPWWPDAQPLLGDVPAGSFVIPVDTTDRLFIAGGLVAIWKDEYTFEALSVTATDAGSVTVASPTEFSWPAGPGTRVIPVLLCRLPSKASVKRLSSEIDQIDVSFIGEAEQPAPAPTISLTQFKGLDVLEVAPNWDDAPLNRDYSRSQVTVDSKLGPVEVIDKGGSPIVGQEFPYWLDTHPSITKFRAFVLRRFGRLNPFWIPTWDQDLVLALDVGAGDPSILIKSVFYTRFFFPNRARRMLAFIPIDGSGNVYREVTGSVDNLDGTETLNLSSATGKNFTAGSTMISFLTLCRLANDSNSIKWDSSEHAESLLDFQELPRELPA